MINSKLKLNEKDIYIKSPLNYIGGKYKLLNQIIPLFPKKINCFVDLFSGGCNVGLNINAKKYYFNDNLIYLIEMYKEFLENDIDYTLNYIEDKICYYNLNKQNEEGYKLFRNEYNINKYGIDLFILVAFSFNHQIRFNNNYIFNNPFGRERSSFNIKMKQNLIKFIYKLKQIKPEFSSLSFKDFDFSIFKKNDFIYLDPPYLLSTGSYNDGKRGFGDWTTNEENNLLEILDHLNSKKIKFALSNVIEHKGNTNTLLKKFIKSNKYKVNYIKMDYNNSNYQTIKSEKTTEVLITNYI